MMTTITVRWLVGCIIVLAPAGLMAGSVEVCFEGQGDLVFVNRVVPTGMSPKEAAIRALFVGPTDAESASGIRTAVPAGTRLVGLQLKANRVEMDLSAEVVANLEDADLSRIVRQVASTLGAFPEITSIVLTHGGKPLTSYLPVLSPVVGPARPQSSGAALVGLQGLSGRVIAVGPSHGRYWDGSGWNWQRTDPCGYGEDVLEDTNSIRLAQLLYQYLVQDGATVYATRELDETVCCHSGTGWPWWRISSYAWLRDRGLPCSVWAPRTGDCSSETGPNRYQDDYTCRPLAADYWNTDIFLASHTNAGSGGYTGTETWYSTNMLHPEHVQNSLALATAINNGAVNAIRDIYDASWTNRGVKDGDYAEAARPDRPACLIELAFHDNCAKDADYLRDDFFRSVAEWGIYAGICQYFGATPTWDRYSNELVSENIPQRMAIGKTYNVTMVFRNRGVVWNSARGFRLGAIDNSDPFTATTRLSPTYSVRPGKDYYFTMALSAPTEPGEYTTDWRMLRETGADPVWFGQSVARQVQVQAAPFVIQQPAAQSSYLTRTVQIQIQADGVAPLTYRWSKDGTNLTDGGHYSGTSTPTLTITNMSARDIGGYRCMVTNDSGNVYSDEAALTCLNPSLIPGDLDGDQDVDLDDFGSFQNCIAGSGVVPPSLPACIYSRLQGNDEDVDRMDLTVFRGCLSGAGVAGDPDCAG